MPGSAACLFEGVIEMFDRMPAAVPSTCPALGLFIADGGHLSVTEIAEDAHRLYVRQGLSRMGPGTSRDRLAGRYADEIHLVLDLGKAI